MIETPDAVQINVTVPRAWKVRAGQYVYLWFPTAGFWSPFQSHPFMVTWWEEVPAGLLVWFLVESREGFTRKLLRYTSFNLMTFLGGPYGHCYDFGSYGTVLMFASGIGIAGHMPYLKTLVERYKRREVSTRRIMLIWQLDKERRHFGMTLPG
jgi:predicted ferric reductase